MDVEPTFREFLQQLDMFKYRHKREYRQLVTKLLQDLFKRNGLIYSKKSIKRIFQSGKINKLQISSKRQQFICKAIPVYNTVWPIHF